MHETHGTTLENGRLVDRSAQLPHLARSQDEQDDAQPGDGAKPVAGQGATLRVLSRVQVSGLVELIAGDPPSTSLVTTLLARTAGDTRRLLALIDAALRTAGADTDLLDALAAEADRPQAGAAGQAVRKEGEYWTLVYDGHLIRLRETNGLRYLAHLLRHPGQRFHASEVMAAAGVCVPGTTERARVAVTKGMKAVLGRLRVMHAPLAEHLEATVRRGYYCSYAPDPRHPVRWTD